MIPSTNAPDAGVSRLTKRAPRVTEENAKEKRKGLAGTYRVIHGQLVVPAPWDTWHGTSGKVRRGAPKTITATIHPSKFAIADDLQKGIFKGDPIEFVGDEVWLSDEDAWTLLAMDKPEDVRHLHALVERLDAKPSMCGKVWVKPKPIPRSS